MARIAIQQAHAQALFERTYDLADGLLADPQP